MTATETVIYTAEDRLIEGLAQRERHGWSVASVTATNLGRPAVVVVYEWGRWRDTK